VFLAAVRGFSAVWLVLCSGAWLICYPVRWHFFFGLRAFPGFLAASRPEALPVFGLI